MSTQAPAAPSAGPKIEVAPGQRFVVYDADWRMYEQFLDLLGNHVRLTYDRGRLELMSPSYAHESAGAILGRLVETLAEELNLPLKAGKSTTFRRQDLDRGLEPDECYYTTNAPRILGRTEIDLSNDPPPDLAIEVDITRSSLNRMAIYAALGVPELWRYDGQALEVYALQSGGTYQQQDHSPTFPALDLNAFTQFLRRSGAVDDTALARQFRAWVRANLLPPAAGEPPAPAL
jgi:Uma2 family endonuclease